jgi:hypothetical protein
MKKRKTRPLVISIESDMIGDNTSYGYHFSMDCVTA